MRVLASDNYCQSPRITAVDVIIRVIRDRKTYFNQRDERFSISEKVPVNTTVGRPISVTDVDLQVANSFSIYSLPCYSLGLLSTLSSAY